MLIEVNSVSKIYNEGKESEVRALDDVSLTIDKGEFVAILGQSGSGKSTLMNILGCLDIPTYGSYRLNGELVSDMSLKKLSDIRNLEIGFIFQGFNLISQMTAFENVELPMIYRGMRYRERVDRAYEILKRLGLDGREKHLPSELSGGQQQRVAIARAIVMSPPIIMADEPTGNLDSRSGNDIMKNLVDLNEGGTTIILITHDLRLAKFAKRVITLKDGKIIGDAKNSDEERQAVMSEVVL